MSLTIAGIEFENHEYDEHGRVIAMTLVNLKRLLERDGELKLTWPEVHVPPDEFSSVLMKAA